MVKVIDECIYLIIKNGGFNVLVRYKRGITNNRGLTGSTNGILNGNGKGMSMILL